MEAMSNTAGDENDDVACVSPSEPMYVTLTIRLCDSWDFVDWNSIVAPRYTAAAWWLRVKRGHLAARWRNR